MPEENGKTQNKRKGNKRPAGEGPAGLNLMTMKIISFLAQKGGTGKTTSAASVGQALARSGNKVLFVDLDTQANLTDVLADNATPNGTILNVLQGEIPALDAVTPTQYGDLLASDPEIDLFQPGIKDLAQALKKAGRKYDFCIIDNPGDLSALTAASIYAADYIIIPIQAERFSIKAVTQLLNTIDTIKAETGHAGDVLGVLCTRFSARTVISRQARKYLQDVAKQGGTSLFNTDIRECTAIKEAQAEGTDIFSYDPRSNAAADYRAVTAEALERIHAAKCRK